MRRIVRSRKADPPEWRIKVGTCGFAIRRPGYYRTFPVVEIQQSFYKLPRVTTGERWRAGAPPGFEFTMKAWQLITHMAEDAVRFQELLKSQLEVVRGRSLKAGH